MADISKITLPSGTTYDLKDQGARDLIAEIESYSSYLGVTTTALTDGATTNPITIGEESVTAKNGSIVNYGSKEFIFNGTAWQEFGDLSALGSLAYKNNASGNFTPSGTVTAPTFTMTAGEFSGSTSKQVVTDCGITISENSGSGSDAGLFVRTASANAPTFTGTQKYLHLSTTKGSVTSTGNFTPSGSVTIAKGTGTANYTPSGTVSQPTFYGTLKAINLSSGHEYLTAVSGSVDTTESGGIDIKPAGTVSTPTITVTPSTTSKYVASSATGGGSVTAGTSASFTATVANEVLTLGWTANTPTAVTLPSFASQTIVTGISSATSSQPTFTGTQKYLHLTEDSDFVTVIGSFTPQGTVSQPTFTGDGVELTGSFSGTQGSVSVSTTGAVTAVSGSVNTTASGGIDIKPAGTVSAPTLNLTQRTLGFERTKETVSVEGTSLPSLTINAPTFNGTQGTVTVS